MENITSEQELKQLLDDGKINRDEYQELLDSMNKTKSGYPTAPVVAEPKLEAFRIRIMTGGLLICAVGLPVWLILKLPIVWGLSILGIIVALVKLSRTKSSWLVKLVNKQK
jgi:hypothetical protein